MLTDSNRLAVNALPARPAAIRQQQMDVTEYKLKVLVLEFFSFYFSTSERKWDVSTRLLDRSAG